MRAARTLLLVAVALAPAGCGAIVKGVAQGAVRGAARSAARGAVSGSGSGGDRAADRSDRTAPAAGGHQVVKLGGRR